MSRNLQIGNDIYPFPDEGENPSYGEDVTEWAQAVTDALENVQGPNDILLSSATLNNNQTTYEDVNGLVFNTGEVQAIEIDYFVVRTYDAGVTVIAESGKMIGNYNGSVFVISVENVGDAGVDFDITNAGQVQYISSDLANHVSSVMKYKAKTIDQA
jgi:hypothetical protein